MRAENSPSAGGSVVGGSLPGEGALADALAETAQCLVCVLDREGRIVRFNHVCEEATGFAAADVVGRDARDLVIPPEDHEAFDAMLEEIWETGDPSPQLGEWVTRDGRRRLIAWANRPLVGEDGRPLYLVTAGLDLTEREQMLTEQSALRRVATLVASGAAPEQVFDAVSQEAACVIGGESGGVARFDDSEAATLVGTWSAPGAGSLPKGTIIPLSGDGTLPRVSRTGASARTDDYAEVTGGAADLVRQNRVTSTAAAPISVSGRLWGALVVGTERDRPLPEDAEERLDAFAGLCSLAIVSADTLQRLLESRASLDAAATEQAALRRVATLVAGDVPPEAVFQSVSEEAARVVGAGAGAVARFEGGLATVVGRWDAAASQAIPVGTVVPLSDDGTMSRVYRTGAPARIDDYEGIAGAAAEHIRGAGFRSVIAAPGTLGGRLWGAIIAGTGTDMVLPPDTEQRLLGFAELVSLAVSSAQAWDDVLDSRARIVEAADSERRRLERNLHDGAQQRLVTTLLLLRAAATRLEGQPEVAEALGNAVGELQRANEDLRELARGLHPVALSERGLGTALRSLFRNAAVPVDLSVPEERLPEAVELAAYYVAAEGVANATKHAEATRLKVDVTTADGYVVVEVCDDGCGGADPAKGSGLRGLADRVDALRGRLEVTSSPGAGTTLRASVPLA